MFEIVQNTTNSYSNKGLFQMEDGSRENIKAGNRPIIKVICKTQFYFFFVAAVVDGGRSAVPS